jgi:hypothetical protein
VSAWVAGTLPFSALLYVWMTVCSAWLYWKTEGVEWKGRRVG